MRTRRLSSLILLVAVVAVFSFQPASAAAQADPGEPAPSVRAFRTFDFDPIFDPVFSLAVVAENLTGCDTPVAEDEIVESRGLSVTVDGEVLFRTGDPNVRLDYGDGNEPVSSYVSHFGVGSFITYVPGSVIAEGESEVLIECRDPSGTWVQVFIGPVLVPSIDIPLWLVGIGGTTPDQQLFAIDMGFGSTPGLTVEFDDGPIAMTPDAEFPDSLSGPLPNDLAPGLHVVTVRASGLTAEQAILARAGRAEAVAAQFAEPPVVESEPEPDGDEAADADAEVAPPPDDVEPPDEPASAVDAEESTEEIAQQDLDDDANEGVGVDDVEQVELAGPYAWVVAPPEFDWSTSSLLVSIGLAVLFVALIGWQADLVNKTIEANRDDIRAWPVVRLLTGGDGGGRGIGLLTRLRTSRHRQVLMLVAYAGVLATLTAIAAPRSEGLRWFDAVVWDAPGTALAILLVVGVYAWSVESVERLLLPDDPAEFRLIPWSIAPAIALTVVSWAGEFRPPYIYGLIGGFLADQALSKRRNGHDDAGRAHAYGAGLLLTLALVFFALAGPFHPLEDGASWFETVRNRFVVGTFVVAIQALVFGLLPLDFMDGARIFRWRRWTWAVLYFLGLAGFLHVLILQRSQAAEAADADAGRAVTSSIALFVGFMVGSFLFWSYFRLRASPRPTGIAGPAEPEESPPASPIEASESADDAADVEGQNNTGDAHRPAEPVPSASPTGGAVPGDAVPDDLDPDDLDPDDLDPDDLDPDDLDPDDVERSSGGSPSEAIDLRDEPVSAESADHPSLPDDPEPERVEQSAESE
ncbi:MAG: FGLLP motif-containing membrane protein [Actinomycetota bacterium]